MEWGWKALLTAVTVAIVLAIARLGGRRGAGVVAALPTVTAPALAWMAHDHGDGFAAEAAIASVSASALLALFAVVHAHVARVRGVAATLGCGILAVTLVSGPVMLVGVTLPAALALAIGSCALAFRCMPDPPRHLLAAVRTPIAATALAAAAIGVLTTALAPLLGSTVSGLVASLPLISGAVAVTEHASVGHAGVAHFQRGYVCGLLARVSFCAAFALLAVPLGWPAALLAAASCAATVSLLMHLAFTRTRHRASRAGPMARGASTPAIADTMCPSPAFGVGNTHGRGHAADRAGARRRPRRVRSTL